MALAAQFLRGVFFWPTACALARQSSSSLPADKSVACASRWRMLPAMSTVQQIEAAIRGLSPAERSRLVSDLPTLLPELDGDAAWEQIIRDPRPRPALTALLDEVDAQRQRDPEAFPIIEAADFDRQV